MKIKTLLLTTTLLASSVAFADAPARVTKKPTNDIFKDFYAKVEAGLTMPLDYKEKDKKGKLKFDKGFVGGIGGGFRFNEFFRSDLMLRYRNFSTKKLTNKATKKTGKIQFTTYSAMLNGYLDAHNDTIFTPYVMAGIGVGRVNPELKGERYKNVADKDKPKSKTNFIWNAGLGCQARIYENISADLGYRYVNLGKALKGMKDTTSTHEVLVGLIYNL